jgi:hypothetical protein
VAAPKPGGIRWLAVLDPSTARRYRGLVARVAARIEARLGPEVVANRVRSAGPGARLRLEEWEPARRRFLQEARRRSRPGDVVAFGDVRACFARITPGAVAVALGGVGCHPSEIGAIRRLLEQLGDAGVPGLPAGPAASAVLANAVLEPVDASLRDAGVRFLRWVDDVVAFCPDADAALRTLAVVERALADLGLELAGEKTRVVDAVEAARRMREAASGAAAPTLG